MKKAFDVGYDVLYSLSPKESFANSVSKENALWRLLQLLERPEPNEDGVDEADATKGTSISDDLSKRKLRGWLVLEALSSSPTVANYILSTVGWIELLGVLVGYAEFTKLWASRMGAAKTLSRLFWDPKTGSLAGMLVVSARMPVAVDLYRAQHFLLPSSRFRFPGSSVSTNCVNSKAQRRP